MRGGGRAGAVLRGVPALRRLQGISCPRLPAAHVSVDRRGLREDLPLGNLALAVPGVLGAVYGLPSFALPYKRFVTEVVSDRSGSFLGTDQSYRQAVRLQGRELVYDDRQDEDLARRGAALAHSTVWRWLSWLGDELQDAFRAVRQLIRERTPGSTLHWEGWGVSPYKYRSEARRLTLQRATEGLVLAEVFRRLFGKAIFPRFATADRRR